MQGLRRFSRRNLIFAALFLCLSLASGLFALTNLPVGTTARMGPGYFPVMLSVLMGGLAVVAAFLPDSGSSPPFRLAPLRAGIAILGAPVLFAFTIRPLGLVVSLLLVIFLSTMASRKTTMIQSMLLTVGFTIFCVVVFHYLLDLPIPLWGTAFRG